MSKTYAQLSRKVLQQIRNARLTDGEKEQVRDIIGATSSAFSGSYDDLRKKPEIPELPDVPPVNTTEDKLYLLCVNQNNYPGVWKETLNIEKEEKNKLKGIEAGAQRNVQADWEETNPNSDAYIKNKPVLTTLVQADWNEEDENSYAFIENKPSSSELSKIVWKNIPTGIGHRNILINIKQYLELSDIDIVNQVWGTPQTITDSVLSTLYDTLDLNKTVSLLTPSFRTDAINIIGVFSGIQLYKSKLYLSSGSSIFNFLYQKIKGERDYKWHYTASSDFFLITSSSVGNSSKFQIYDNKLYILDNSIIKIWPLTNRNDSLILGTRDEANDLRLPNTHTYIDFQILSTGKVYLLKQNKSNKNITIQKSTLSSLKSPISNFNPKLPKLNYKYLAVMQNEKFALRTINSVVIIDKNGLEITQLFKGELSDTGGIDVDQEKNTIYCLDRFRDHSITSFVYYRWILRSASYSQTVVSS